MVFFWFKVKITNPIMKLVDPDDYDYDFKPNTTSQYSLVSYENSSRVELLDTRQSRRFEHLTNMLIRDENDFFVLEDVYLSERLQNKSINLLFMIRQVI